MTGSEGKTSMTGPARSLTLSTETQFSSSSASAGASPEATNCFANGPSSFSSCVRLRFLGLGLSPLNVSGLGMVMLIVSGCRAVTLCFGLLLAEDMNKLSRSMDFTYTSRLQTHTYTQFIKLHLPLTGTDIWFALAGNTT
jgi:hypothetical protein